MDFDFQKRAAEQGINLNDYPDASRASFMLTNIDVEAMVRCIEVARADIQKFLGPAIPVYRYDKDGVKIAVGIAILEPALDALGNLATTSKQPPVQYLTEIRRYHSGFTLANWLELWFEAFNKCYVRRDHPVYEQIQERAK